MSTYSLEFDNATLDKVIHDLREGLGGDFYEELARTLERQRPIPAPTRIGAVVRTERGMYIRADASPQPWILVRLNGFVETPSWLPEPPGRITDVLFDGVDL